jgi:hypothetical protein
MSNDVFACSDSSPYGKSGSRVYAVVEEDDIEGRFLKKENNAFPYCFSNKTLLSNFDFKK